VNVFYPQVILVKLRMRRLAKTRYDFEAPFDKAVITDRATDVTGITHPFVDTWNLRYLGMSRETRAKKLVTVTRRFADYRTDKENIRFRRAVDEAVQEYQCDESDLRFPHLQYPDEIDW